MAKALNQNGIALIQDVVVNHTGDYFDIDSAGKFRAWNLDKPLQGYLRNWPVKPSSSWRSSIYHRTGPITDYNDSLQRLTGQMSGLDDLNTSNPLVQRRLKKDYHRWIKSGGLRGMRFDTPLYVEHDFWKNFLKGMPVYSFGELWTHSPAWSDRGERLAASYVMPGQGIDAALQFPLQKTILEVLDGTRSSAHLSYRLSVERLHFPNPLQRVHFLDNHDMPRISTRLDSLQIAQALLLLYSMPGIPVLYYGTESALKGSRDDYFDAVQRPGPYREWIRALSHLRYQEKALREGLTEVVLDSRMGTSIWMAWIDRRWMIALNLSKHQISIPDSLIRAALPLLTRRAHQPMLQCGPAGSWDRDSLVMNPGEAWIWAVHTQENLLNQISAPLPAQSLGFEAWSSIEPILRNSTLVAEFPDPPGDDSGSNGQIQYPKAFDGRPGDIRGLRWLHSDAGYVLEIQMQEPLSTLWNPPHGMDHVNLHISLNAPTLLEFHLDGWNASGSTTWEWFTDAGQGKIYALFPRGSMVSPSTITVQTWDSDGNGEPRTLSLNPGAYEFRGDPSTEKWIDKAFLTLDP
jgi:hypothetical protein